MRDSDGYDLRRVSHQEGGMVFYDAVVVVDVPDVGESCTASETYSDTYNGKTVTIPRDSIAVCLATVDEDGTATAIAGRDAIVAKPLYIYGHDCVEMCVPQLSEGDPVLLRRVGRSWLIVAPAFIYAPEEC